MDEKLMNIKIKYMSPAEKKSWQMAEEARKRTL